MTLYVPLPSVFKFQRLFDDSKLLQKYLTQDPRTMSVWYIEEACDMEKLKEILKNNHINYRIKK